MNRILRNLIVAFVAVFAANVFACSVPVFRYALERWPADPYGVLVLHRGEMTPEQTALYDRLSPDTRKETDIVNLVSNPSNLDSETNPRMLRIWEDLKTDELPHMVLYYPRQSGVSDIVWSGALNRENVDRLIDSPARREIARRLLQQDSAVWALIETGNKERDDAVAKLIDKRLDELEKELKLPEIQAQDVADGLISIPESELRISFSSIRISREDAREDVFLQQLLGMESDLRELREPIAFPIFGRGRALYALAGQGINTDNISDAAAFLIGPCSCQVKDQNPGVDVLMAVDWDRLVRTEIDVEKELPPLSGFLAPAIADDFAGSTAADPDVEASGAESRPTAATPVPSSSSDDLAEATSSTMRLSILVVGAMAAAAMLMGYFFFGRKD